MPPPTASGDDRGGVGSSPRFITSRDPGPWLRWACVVLVDRLVMLLRLVPLDVRFRESEWSPLSTDAVTFGPRRGLEAVGGGRPQRVRVFPVECRDPRHRVTMSVALPRSLPHQS